METIDVEAIAATGQPGDAACRCPDVVVSTLVPESLETVAEMLRGMQRYFDDLVLSSEDAAFSADAPTVLLGDSLHSDAIMH